MAEFVLKNNFEFNEKVCRQISGPAIGTKIYTCIDEIETSFLKTQEFQPVNWLRHIDDIFFIRTHGEEQLKLFLKYLNEFHPNLKFMYEASQNSVNFLDLNVDLKIVEFSLTYILNPQMVTSSYIINHFIQEFDTL